MRWIRLCENETSFTRASGMSRPDLEKIPSRCVNRCVFSTYRVVNQRRNGPRQKIKITSAPTAAMPSRTCVRALKDGRKTIAAPATTATRIASRIDLSSVVQCGWKSRTICSSSVIERSGRPMRHIVADHRYLSTDRDRNSTNVDDVPGTIGLVIDDEAARRIDVLRHAGDGRTA